MVAGDIYDVRARAKDVVRAGREDDLLDLRIVLPLERHLNHGGHLSIREDNAQSVKIGHVREALSKRGQNGVRRVPCEAERERAMRLVQKLRHGLCVDWIAYRTC